MLACMRVSSTFYKSWQRVCLKWLRDSVYPVFSMISVLGDEQPSDVELDSEVSVIVYKFGV